MQDMAHSICLIKLYQITMRKKFRFFVSDCLKLMNNSVFGKTMENLRKMVDVRLVTNEKKLDKLTSKPTFVSSKIINENLMAVHKVKETLTLNGPAYVGMCILDLSKTLMYDFHYNYIKRSITIEPDSCSPIRTA